MSASGNILAYIIYIIKEVAEGIEHGVGLCFVFYGIGIDDGLESQGLHLHINVGTGHDGVAVVVDGSRS